jgi:hypothetical protein
MPSKPKIIYGISSKIGWHGHKNLGNRNQTKFIYIIYCKYLRTCIRLIWEFKKKYYLAKTYAEPIFFSKYLLTF